MNKTQAVWLVVRIAGILAMFNSLRLVLVIIQNAFFLNGVEVPANAVHHFSSLQTGIAVEAILYLAIAIYLLYNGKILFLLLDHEPAEVEESAGVETFKVTE